MEYNRLFSMHRETYRALAEVVSWASQLFLGIPPFISDPRSLSFLSSSLCTLPCSHTVLYSFLLQDSFNLKLYHKNTTRVTLICNRVSLFARLTCM